MLEFPEAQTVAEKHNVNLAERDRAFLSLTPRIHHARCEIAKTNWKGTDAERADARRNFAELVRLQNYLAPRGK